MEKFFIVRTLDMFDWYLNIVTWKALFFLIKYILLVAFKNLSGQKV